MKLNALIWRQNGAFSALYHAHGHVGQINEHTGNGLFVLEEVPVGDFDLCQNLLARWLHDIGLKALTIRQKESRGDGKIKGARSCENKTHRGLIEGAELLPFDALERFGCEQVRRGADKCGHACEDRGEAERHHQFGS